MVEKIRSVKEPAEVEAISASTRVTRSVLAGALGAVKPGLAEESLARKIETEFLKRGAKPAFDPIVASGKNSSKPHALPGPARIKRDSFVMLDIGCRLRGYCSDMTRTVITGAVSGRFARIYNVVRTAQRMALDRIRDGARASEVDFAARGYICRKGLGKFFGHSLGHGVGMDVHEAPALSGRNSGFLRAGMVMTVEPAVYIRGFGGVRIEDMVLVTERGYEMLTQ
jgi:Xaa-Pro aminopeptidase